MPLDRHSISVVQVKVTWDGKAPTTVYVPANLVARYLSSVAIGDDDDTVSEYLSDQHGYRVKAWEVAE